ncbi:lachesin-like [Tigriopus californicus]|uniref:lachesin-like n=1 Tax=Tigriopus californicus TaxID=6832 RepID=UPI0027D9FA2C|nr:lachesin-like [Tigriopus californicus]
MYPRSGSRGTLFTLQGVFLPLIIYGQGTKGLVDDHGPLEDRSPPFGSVAGMGPGHGDNEIRVFQSAYSPSRPEFAGRIKNITVNVGREAILECHVNHLGRYKVGWLKAKDQTILALHKRVITHNSRIDVDHEENRNWMLKIHQVQESDKGCYMCQINTEEMKKQIGCIDVLIPPNIVDNLTSSDVIVNEGEDAILVCRASGHPEPQILWLREDKKEFVVYSNINNHTRRETVTQYRGPVLVMRKVQRHQMGAYLCIAQNDVPPAVSKRIILNVNFKPEINVPSQLHGVGPGSSVTLTCVVQAFPTAINYWMKDGKKMLLDNDKYNISEDRKSLYERVMSLTIRNWEKSDEGHFMCMSTNSLGEADGTIQSYTFEAQTEPTENRYVEPTSMDYDYYETTLTHHRKEYYQAQNDDQTRLQDQSVFDRDSNRDDDASKQNRQRERRKKKRERKQDNSAYFGHQNSGSRSQTSSVQMLCIWTFLSSLISMPFVGTASSIRSL